MNKSFVIAMAFSPGGSVFSSSLENLDTLVLKRIRGLFLVGRHNTSEVFDALVVSLSRLGRHCTTLLEEVGTGSASDHQEQISVSEVFQELENLPKWEKCKTRFLIYAFRN
jgi:hypothetical protein